MIKPDFSTGRLTLKCDCGNTDQNNFGNYVKTRLFTDERGRNKRTRERAYLCGVCKCNITIGELSSAIKSAHEKTEIDKAEIKS